LVKKQKKTTPERIPAKRQLSKWQRQEKIRRIVIIAAIVFLVGISSWVGYEYYQDYKASAAPWQEVMISVNGVNFTMEYFVDMFDAFTRIAGWNSSVLYTYGGYLANMVADQIIDSELLRQGAKKDFGIEVTSSEIDAKLKESGWPGNRVYRDMVGSALLQEKLGQRFGSNITSSMEQAWIQVMLVESQEVAHEVIGKIRGGANFTALVPEFSCNSTIEGDLGWLPRELVPNTLIADVAFSLAPGNVSQPLYDETAIKSVGYWLIEVTEKQDEQIRARAILLGSEAEAEQIRAQFLAGGNFSALAGNYSQHASRNAGGDLGLLKRGDMDSTAFDNVAFNMTLNKLSQPVRDTSVETAGGYWLVMVVDRGERDLDNTTKEKLIDKRYNDWRRESAEKSKIETYLGADKIWWAVTKVLERR